MLERWRKAAEISAEQHGAIAIAQLLAAGFTRRTIGVAVANGNLLPLHRGVYAVGHLPEGAHVRRVAATLAIGDDAWTSNRSAAEHLRVLRPRTGPIHVTVPGRSGRKRRDGIVVHRAKLAADERTVVEQVRCTTMSRTLLDLSAERPGEIERAIKAAGDRGLLSVHDCLTLIERYPGRPGTPLLRRLLVGEQPVPEFTRSGLERRMYRLCRAAGLPLPNMNVDIAGAVDVHECDAAWPRHRLIIECDSGWHDNPITANRDAKKDQDLTLAAWRVHRLRWVQIVLEPMLCARTIAHLLTEQARLVGLAA